MVDVELVRRLGAALCLSDEDLRAARAEREQSESAGEEFESVQPSPKVNLSDEELAGLVSEEARAFVIGYEVTSRSHYEAKLTVPDWPGGRSGVTIGIGYDLGYVSWEEFSTTWAGLISNAEIAALHPAIGKKGSEAKAIVGQFSKVSVPWVSAEQAFVRSTVPKFARQVLSTYPNAADLKGHCFGALFSLVFNRGASLEGERRKEMRAIRELIADGNYDPIPQLFRDMCRLWKQPLVRGLIARREAEAEMFQRGLELRRQQSSLAAACAEGGPHLESVEDEHSYDGDGLYYEYDSAESNLEAVSQETASWDSVKWPADDAKAPDYGHLDTVDRLTLAGKPFEFGPKELELLIAANSFDPIRERGRLIFALRGAQLIKAIDQPSAVIEQQVGQPALFLKDVQPDHRHLRCVIGVYDIKTQRLSGFASSTVPNRKAVASYVAKGKSGNMTPTGCYRLQVGWHHASDELNKIPGCLVEWGRTKAVIRSKNDCTYDVSDEFFADRATGNNLHPAGRDSSAEFSSWGCLVVKGGYDCDGDRSKGRHTGQWGAFREALGLSATGTSDHKREYDVVLLTGREGAIANSIIKQGAAAPRIIVDRRLYRIRQGSRGEAVSRLQTVLGLAPTGVLDFKTAKALADRQKQDFNGLSDGIHSPERDRWNVFRTEPPVTVASADGGPVLESVASDVPDASLAGRYCEIGLEYEALRGLPGAELESLSEIGLSLLDRSKAIIADLERQLQQVVCNAAASGSDLFDVRGQIDWASKRGAEALKRCLTGLLSVKTGLPPSFTAKVVDLIFDKVIAPLASQASQSAADRVNVTAQWLCQQWQQRLAGAPLAELTANPPATVPAQSVTPAAPSSPIPGKISTAGVSFPAAPQPPAPVSNTSQAPDLPPPPPGGSSATGPGPTAEEGALAPSKLLALLEAAIKGPEGTTPDLSAARQRLTELRRWLEQSASSLSNADALRLVSIFYDALLLDGTNSASFDPRTYLKGIETALNQKPAADIATARQLIDELHEKLANAHAVVCQEDIKTLLKLVQNARLFNELTLLADRFYTRDPSVFPVVRAPYAQGLIDSGRLQAAIDLLEGSTTGSPPRSIDESGILGRAYKQMYVNHVKSPTDAIGLSQRIGPQLTKSIKIYGDLYDPAQPRLNPYHGINYIALVCRAERDGIEVTPKASAKVMAQNLLSAHEKEPLGTDFWTLATMGEAALAAGDLEKSAAYYAQAAGKGTAFELASATRQLEQIWEVKPSKSGAGAILLNLMGVLSQKEGSNVTLSPEVKRQISSPSELQFSRKFETMIDGGGFTPYALLQRIVERGRSVALIQKVIDNNATAKGTGFLVNGSELTSALRADRSYLLTNAHVVWDDSKGPGPGMSPALARIVFDSDAADGRAEFYTGQVVWQSAQYELDATLLELDRPVPNRPCIPLASSNERLVVYSRDTAHLATRVAILGHPDGGNLAVSYAGTLEQMQGVLVDLGRKSQQQPVFLHYTTPTKNGNSGSPVFEATTWKVVSLHHAGYKPEIGGIEKLDGKAGFNIANEGVSIWSIRDAIKAHFGG